MSRQAIATVRRLLAGLSRPVPEFTSPADRLLTVRLPLEDVSPFDALPPDTIGAEQSEATVYAAQARGLARAAEGAARTSSSPAIGRGGYREAEMPAFSFRRPAFGIRSTGRSAAPVLAGAPASAGPANSGSVAPETARSGIGTSGSPGLEKNDGSVVGSPTLERTQPERADVPDPLRAIRTSRGPDPLRKVEPQSIGSSESRKPHEFAGNPPAARTTQAAGARQPVLALVGAMADEILAAERTRLIAAAESGADVKEPRLAPELPLANRTQSEPRSAVEWTGKEPVPFDAERVAELVNEALAEQARRHGVDLS